MCGIKDEIKKKNKVQEEGGGEKKTKPSPRHAGSEI